MDISVIVPLFNEAESLPKLYEWIAKVMKENKFSYEVIFVNDGSTDESSAGITERVQRYTAVLKQRKGMWSLRWMLTCRILRTRFRNSTE